MHRRTVLPPGALLVATLGCFWLIAINQLRVEWSVNPQYSYGWAVPVLCAGLVWRKIQKAESRKQKAESAPISTFNFPLSTLPKGFRLSTLAFVLLAFLWLPTRLIQEANPEWRLVSWALAIEVVGLTLLAAYAAGDRRWEMEVRSWQTGDGRWEAAPELRSPNFDLRPRALSHLPSSIFYLRTALFPVLFFFVAVPWPTIIEGPLIQGLTRANAATTVEALGWFGVPAMQHGNVIEVGTGMVGIDEACSGIRSLQSTLMISLFLGELYALSAKRRALCVLIGFVLAFLFNVCRTFILVSVAAKEGIPAIQNWHDPAGFSIMVACLLGLWAVSVLLRNQKSEIRNQKSASGSVGPTLRPGNPTGWKRAQRSAFRFPLSAFQFSAFSFRLCTFSLLAWLVVVEVGVELWYRVHEWNLPKSVGWIVETPREAVGLREVPLPEKARQFLRYDEALNVTWRDGDIQWQVISLRWRPGRIAVHLAKTHTPEVCLTAAGKRLVSASDLKWFAVGDLRLPFRAYQVEEQGRPVHIFYCIWEDRAEDQAFETEHLTYGNRLAPVLAGRRNCGQRSLELAVWGIDDSKEAEAAVVRQLERLVVVERLKS